MPKTTFHVAPPRAINLAGHNKVKMADLRQWLTGLGAANVQSVPQSGNLVFEGEAATTSDMESLLEGSARARLGLDTDFFVRTASEWGEIISGYPFPAEAEGDPAHLVVMFLKDAPSRERVVDLEGAIRCSKIVRAKKNLAYIIYLDGIGRSQLTNVLIERVLGTRGTARNWNTVIKLSPFIG
jgi:uncharacterized protein (DUF1697 family)